MQATVNCGNCGTQASWSDDISDHDEVKCAQCGETLGTFREIVDAVEKAAVKKIEEMLGGSLKDG
jgi:endogenous inhibitor of DNA gyrase (YacG/DUF329 family)